MTITFTPQTTAASPQRTSERVTHIRPSRGWFDLQLDEAWRYRGLLATLVQRDIQVLYKQAFLGAAWAIIQPVLAVIIFTVVFGVLMKVPTPAGIPYPIFAFAAVLPWNYFAEGLRRGATGLVVEALHDLRAREDDVGDRADDLGDERLIDVASARGLLLVHDAWCRAGISSPSFHWCWSPVCWRWPFPCGSVRSMSAIVT